MLSVSHELEHLNFFIDDTPALSIAALRTRARRLKRTHGLGLLIIDYLQLLSPSGKSRQENRVQEVSEITRGLKTLAKELDVPVLALSQLSRAVEQREDKRPQLADLREVRIDRAGCRRRDVHLSRRILPHARRAHAARPMRATITSTSAMTTGVSAVSRPTARPK